MAITERDSMGRIVKSSLSSERAKEIGRIGNVARKGASMDQLLVEAGHEPEEAPEHLRILAKLAQSSPPAMRDFLKMTKVIDDKAEVVLAIPGELCPTCSQYVLTDLQMTDEQVGTVLESIDGIRG